MEQSLDYSKISFGPSISLGLSCIESTKKVEKPPAMASEEQQEQSGECCVIADFSFFFLLLCLLDLWLIPYR
ncbi:hypothetical protein Y032_0128g1458 [Ancylostoma ceylanicum]|uniref:Uncharacterized protein n=1 Tax=Ancylostoma ceylanicum TaxID=53326 RepID=A0A016T806_9BILA|nr:hypothetical protein Y032_0128g1458 [Ancylostoma ceylanicum]